jgi:parvulin-like peptidyl-prolyl isomerase
LKVSKPVGEATISYQSKPAVEYAQPNYIFAKVGEEYITLMVLESIMQRMIPALREHYRTQEAKERLLRSVVTDKLFFRAAKDMAFDEIPEVKSKIDEAVERTLSREYRIKIQQVTVSEKELLDYYEKNMSIFQIPEQIMGKRILVQTKQEAIEALALLKAGTAFEDLAKERSKDATAKNGGHFGWIRRGRMDLAVDEAAFALDKGDVSGIIETKKGYYIVKVEDKRRSRQLPFSDVMGNITKILKAKKQKDQTEKKSKELEKKYQVQLHPELLPKLKVFSADGGNPEDTIQMIQDFFQRPY